MGAGGGGPIAQQGTGQTGSPGDTTGMFVARILGETEDVWSQVLPQQANIAYQKPILVLFSGLTLLTAYPALAWLVAAPSFPNMLIVLLWLSFLYGSGDKNPFDHKATGFDAIQENPQFAGGDTSYWISQAVPLVGGPSWLSEVAYCPY